MNASRRPLSNRELVYVIQDHHVLESGELAVGFRLHVGRTDAHGDHVIALACGIGPEPRFVYPYLTIFPWSTAFVCKNCVDVLRAELEGRSDALWTNDAPFSNTGVNS